MTAPCIPKPVSKSADRHRLPRIVRRVVADKRGVSAIEFAIAIGFLAMIILSSLDFGRTLAARNEMSHALSRATRAVNLNPNTTPEEVQEFLEGALARYEGTDLDVQIDEIDGTSYMRISVSFPFNSSMPFREAETTLTVSTQAPMVSPTL
jgi:Flp pilus assembly protein TadG